MCVETPQTTPTMSTPKPFLKWPGNKHGLAAELCKSLPPGRRLIEPFVGSGAVFLSNAHRYDRFLVADINPDLIALFKLLQGEGEDFIDECARLFSKHTNQEDAYYRLRSEYNTVTDRHRRAVLFLYLNRHGFNGLCRYNRSGDFNVSFGRYARPYFPRREMLGFHHAVAHNVEFRVASFECSLSEAGPGDVVYCDPPYVPLTATAGFTAYAGTPFGPDAQRMLSERAREAARRGAVVVLSNHDTPYTRALYEGARIQALQVPRFIAADAHSRGAAPELIATFDGSKAPIRAVA